jgi:hypothetical protein
MRCGTSFSVRFRVIDSLVHSLPPPLGFWICRILKDFKSLFLDLRIVKELRAQFSDLRILRDLGQIVAGRRLWRKLTEGFER